MFAIIECGGKQYKVHEGDTLEVELLNPEEIKNKKSSLKKVLLINDKKIHLGNPYLKNTQVDVEIIDEFLSPKIIVFKKKAKKQYKRTNIHQQKLHKIKIIKISLAVKNETAKKEIQKQETLKKTSPPKATPKKASVKKTTTTKLKPPKKTVQKKPTAAKPKKQEK